MALLLAVAIMVLTVLLMKQYQPNQPKPLNLPEQSMLNPSDKQMFEQKKIKAKSKMKKLSNLQRLRQSRKLT